MSEQLAPDHETFALELYERRLGQYALFEELMGYVDTGDCTFDQAIKQYKHDLDNPE